MQDISLRIATLRGRMSQRELARRSGIDVSTISRIETGKVQPSLSTLVRVAEGLTVSLDQLVGRSEHPSRSLLRGLEPHEVTPPAVPLPAEQTRFEMQLFVAAAVQSAVHPMKERVDELTRKLDRFLEVELDVAEVAPEAEATLSQPAEHVKP